MFHLLPKLELSVNFRANMVFIKYEMKSFSCRDTKTAENWKACERNGDARSKTRGERYEKNDSKRVDGVYGIRHAGTRTILYDYVSREVANLC